MSQYYRPNRKYNLYNPDSTELFRLGRSKIDLFINCPRCFYLDRKLGAAQPPGYPFSLNSAVDKLLKKEFDLHRAKGTTHPLMKTYGIDAVPLSHDKINEWRDSLRGGITCAIDDLWINSKGEYIVVDYKSTSKSEEIIELNKDWQDGYKRQMEVYQWLLRQNGYKVSSTGYFVYRNGQTDRKAFDGKLEFDVTLIAYEGDDSWVEGAVTNACKCLQSDEYPESGEDCDYCAYHKAVSQIER